MSSMSRRQRLEEMLANDPTDPFVSYGLAMEHLGEGDDSGAVKCFAELIAVSPDTGSGF